MKASRGPFLSLAVFTQQQLWRSRELDEVTFILCLLKQLSNLCAMNMKVLGEMDLYGCTVAGMGRGIPVPARL